MNPIDAVRKEIAWGTDCNAIDGTDEAKCNWPLRCICHEAAVKALLALAEVELPEEAKVDGADVIAGPFSEGPVGSILDVSQDTFRAILRSIAGDLVQTTVGIPSGHQKTENVE